MSQVHGDAENGVFIGSTGALVVAGLAVQLIRAEEDHAVLSLGQKTVASLVEVDIGGVCAVNNGIVVGNTVVAAGLDVDGEDGMVTEIPYCVI